MTWRTSLGCLALMLLSCSSGTEPQDPDAAGSYNATTLTVVDGGQTIDVLAVGGSLTMTLHASGTTSGRLFAPCGGDNGQDLDENLAGTWTQTGSTVRFSQAADTFIRDATWTVDSQTLRTTYTSGGTTVTAMLTRQ